MVALHQKQTRDVDFKSALVVGITAGCSCVSYGNHLHREGYVFVDVGLFVSKIMQKNFGRFSQNPVESWRVHAWATEETNRFWCMVIRITSYASDWSCVILRFGFVIRWHDTGWMYYIQCMIVVFAAASCSSWLAGIASRPNREMASAASCAAAHNS